MFEDASLGANILTNPGQLQIQTLTELNNRLNGIYSIADPNNGFNFILEFGSSAVAASTKYMESEFESWYAKRATTSAELYKNLSDYDYLNIVAQPASSSVRLTFDADYLKQNALSFNTEYNKVVIPASSVFTLGNQTYGIYYPIEIQINKFTGNITTIYDTTISNPLKTLSNNLVDSVIWPYSGLNLLTLSFPVWQFAVTTDVEPVIQETGFSKQYSYTDNFYAARVYTNTGANQGWVDLAYTLSEVYDVSVATAQLFLQMDTNTITITIPQIYFSNGLIGNKVKVELYTTVGALDITLTNDQVSSCTVGFGLSADDVTIYSSLLAKLPTLQLIPSNTTIVGGSNGLTFEELRTAIVNGSLYNQVPITPAELESFISRNGFSLTKYIDNITNRIYYANSTLAGGANGTIPVVNANIKLDTSTLTTTATIKLFSDNIITVFPTTIFQYYHTSNICLPLTDAQVSHLNSLSKDDLCTELNTNQYTQQPFHIVTYTNGKYPLSKSFNLLNPTIGGIQFVRENVNSAAQMTLVAAQVIHQGLGTGGYIVRLAVKKTTDIEALDESNLTIILSVVDNTGQRVFVQAIKSGDAPAGTSYTTIYDCAIPTTYHITQDGYFETLLNETLTTTLDCNISLTTTFDVKFFVNKTLYPTIPQDYTITQNVSGDIVTDQLALSYQMLTVTFGSDMSNGIFNITDAVYGSQAYMTWPETIYHTYPNDVFSTNSNGALIYNIVSGQVVLTKLHSAGDTVLDPTALQPIVKHAAGSNKLDASGNLIPTGNREIVYLVQAMQFDTRLYLSDNLQDQEYVTSLPTTIESYTSTVLTLADQLLEQTALYFSPNNSIGLVTYGIGGGNTAKYPLGLSFSFTVYIPNYNPLSVSDQQLASTIKTTIISILNSAMSNNTISMTAIAETIKSSIGSSITSIDVDGINGVVGLQTLEVQSGSSSPTIGLLLVHQSDDSLKLEPAVTITYLAS